MAEKIVIRSVVCRRCGKKSRAFQVRPFFKNQPKGWYYSNNEGRWYCPPCHDRACARLLGELGKLAKKNEIPMIDLNTGERLV